MVKLKNISEKIYVVLLCVFLYAPIMTLIILSFNASKSRAKWGGFTLQWYKELFKNEQIMMALYNTLLIAFLSAVIATLLGTLAAIAMNHMKKKPKAILMSLTNIPMLNAEIVTGVSLMLLFLALRFRLGFSTILLGHITFNIPYVILSVMPKLKQTNKSTYEAALDLGASPFSAFIKIVMPDLLPGILSGFLLAFTMSLDDFIITHFTKGAGIDTLSTKIYTEVRKGIKPEMYALSTLLFVTVFALLLIINKKKAKKPVNLNIEEKKRIPKKILIPASIAALALVIILFNKGKNSGSGNGELYIYNWGEYIDTSVLEQFEKETGIKPVYDEFETNEDMYPIVKTGSVQYDVICPSDYMADRMIKENLLYPLDPEKIPNLKNLDPAYLKNAQEFDPENRYFVPYCWGTLGILYNKKMVNEPIDSWSTIFDPKYKGNIIMMNSVRDALGLTLKYLGFSLNSTNESELNQARDLLKEQSKIVQGYAIDQVRDKMIGNEAAIGVIYSGEAIYTKRENPDLEYVIPKEGSNVWIDGWVIPQNAPNKENAEKFINFLLRPDIALKNFEYITYSTPNKAARELIEDEDIRNSTIAFPTLEMLKDCETFHFLGDEMDKLYNEKWREVKSGN